MGGDGGVIAVKREFVRGCRNKNEEEAKDAETAKQQAVNRSKHCAISNEKLVQPIVACELGHLYNKEALLTALLEKSLNTKFSHIRGLKDVKALKFAPNPDFREGMDVDGALLPQFRCPVTQMDFNGIHPFVCIWTSGWVLSEKAIREIGIAGLQGEYGPFVENDIIRLIPAEAETQVLRERMDTKRRLKKKRSREAAATSSDIMVTENSAHAVEALEADPKKSAKPAAAARPADISFGKGFSHAASASVHKKEGDSDVYKKLFHTDKEAKTNNRDLMMSVAGFRYGLS